MNRIGYDTIEFDGFPIRVLRNDPSLIWLCLQDICEVLKRPIMMENKEAINICPSAAKMQFKRKDQSLWAVPAQEVYLLINRVKTENSQIRKLCAEFECWVIDLLHKAEELDLDIPIVYSYNNNPVTFKTASGKTMVNATSMAKCFDKQPSVWLHSAPAMEIRETLVKEGKSENLEEQVMTTRGVNGATWIVEDLAMEFSKWLSPEFSIWCNERMKELMTQGHVSLQVKPVQETPESTEPFGGFPVPTTFEEALLLAAKQQALLEENKPKVDYYDRVIENRDDFMTSFIANELGITPNALNRFLQDEGIVRWERRAWAVIGSHSALQTDLPYYWRNKKGKVQRCGFLKRWTKAGREFIHELWYSKHENINN